MYARDTEIPGNELEDGDFFSIKNINTFDPFRDTDDDEEYGLEYHVINACSLGHLQIIHKYLQSHDINEFLNTGWTLLLYAASYAQVDIVEYLITNGADVNKHKDGFTPLMALCNCTQGTTEKRIKCLTLLIKANANANTSSKQRQTPLMYACALQELEFIQELIKYTKNINLCDSRKQTALMYAAIANKPDTVKLLLENAADVTLTDYRNFTAKDIASLKGHNKVLLLFDFNEEEIINVIEISKIYDWKDMFPSLISKSDQTIDCDVYTILNGMALGNYAHSFQKTSLKNFLNLTEIDLCRLGIEISAHRIQFLEYLHKFHRKKWSIHSFGAIDKSLPYTLYNGVVSLGTVAKQLAVIGSSFQYIHNNLTEAYSEDICLTTKQVSNYTQELKKVQTTLGLLKKELKQLKTLSKRIEKENNIGTPATYIGPKTYTSNWLIPLSIITIMGIYIYRTGHVQDMYRKI